jgi:ribosomal protein S18 acetylase RimI-like enzyme
MGQMDVSELEIVAFETRYASSFFELNKAWLEAHFLIEPYDFKVLQNPREMVLEKGGYIFFGTISEEVVATFALTPSGPASMELNKMAVREDWRSKGIGHRLMSFALAHCQALELEVLELYTHTKLQSALHLYRKFGFEVVPVPSDCVYERADIRMQRVLRTTA